MTRRLQLPSPRSAAALLGLAPFLLAGFAQAQTPAGGAKLAQTTAPPATRSTPAPRPDQNRAAQAAKPAADPLRTGALPAPQETAPRLLRSEVSSHDFWTVACDHFEAPTGTRCLARLPVFQNNELKQVLVVLSVGKGGIGARPEQWLLNVHVPTSISLPAGAEIRFGDKAGRKIVFQSCEPALCTASLPLDAALRAELSGADKATAVWTSLIGGEIRAEFPLRGAGPALAALAKAGN